MKQPRLEDSVIHSICRAAVDGVPVRDILNSVPELTSQRLSGILNQKTYKHITKKYPLVPVTRPHYSDEDIQRILHMHEGGNSRHNIAKIIGCTEAFVSCVINGKVKRVGFITDRIEVAEYGRKAYSDTDNQKMLELLDSGWTHKAIAAEFGCSTGHVYNLKRKREKVQGISQPARKVDRTMGLTLRQRNEIHEAASLGFTPEEVVQLIDFEVDLGKVHYVITGQILLA